MLTTQSNQHSLANISLRKSLRSLSISKTVTIDFAIFSEESLSNNDSMDLRKSFIITPIFYSLFMLTCSLTAKTIYFLT